jgi:hypothetical protein
MSGGEKERPRETCLYFLERQLSPVAFFAAAKRQMPTARCSSPPLICLSWSWSWPAMLNARYVCVRSLRLNLLVLRSHPIPSSHCSLPPFRYPPPARSSRLNAWRGGTASWRSKRPPCIFLTPSPPKDDRRRRRTAWQQCNQQERPTRGCPSLAGD